MVIGDKPIMERLNYNGTRKLPQIFNEDEIPKLIWKVLESKDYWKKGHYKDWGDFFKARDLCLIATIYSLGCRPNEACCLKFKDFNFQNMTVKIHGINNKTRKDRIVPIPRSLMTLYNYYFKFSKNRFWRGSEYLFPSFQNNHISPGRLKHIFREKVLKPLDLWYPAERGKVPMFRLYTLRHSRASHILNQQIKENKRPDLFMISNFLGHSDIRSTLVYLHTDKNYINYMKEQTDF